MRCACTADSVLLEPIWVARGKSRMEAVRSIRPSARLAKRTRMNMAINTIIVAIDGTA